MADIPCMPLKKVTDGPLFGQPNGTLSSLINMHLDPDGYAEARGGLDKIKPVGGSSADAISSGAYSTAHQISTNYGWIRTFDSAAGVGSQYSKNVQLWGGWKPFPTNVAGDILYFGSDFVFSMVGISLMQPAVWGATTFVYEYWNGSAWSALTTTTTIDWASATYGPPQYASWTTPSNWVKNTVGDAGTGNILKYWMRIRASAIAGLVSGPVATFAFGVWGGMRELYALTTAPGSGAASGTLKRLGQSSTTTEWFSINAAVASLNGSPDRTASYRGRLFFVNGRDQKRWDGFNYVDVGLTAFSGTGTATAVAGGGMGNGVWYYYMAWGYGPCQSLAVYVAGQDVQPLYGVGRAAFVATATTVAGGNEQVQVTLTSVCPADATSVFLYRTNDLTNVPPAERPNHPAFLLHSYRRRDLTGAGDFEAGFGPVIGTAYLDNSRATAFPPTEAKNYDISPPSRAKHVAVYQNRLFLGDDETIYWSDAFFPDSFSLKSTTGYLRLARSLGGRHMGMVEFADQLVAFTEDQTWGITNVDLDVPQLFPIHPGVGCVAPDSIAVGDGVLIWLARDGFYAWTGGREAPKKISEDMDTTFGRMSYDSHGGSKAEIHNRKYDIRLSNSDYSVLGAAWRFSLRSMQWSQINHASMNSTMFPLAAIHAPLGNSDEGVLHPLWGKCHYSTGTDFALYLGELTTQDNGNNYTCSATMHFPVKPDGLYVPKRLKCYYQASDGWGTPTLSISSGTPIGSGLGTLNTGSVDSGTDYRLIAGTFSQVSRGTSDIVLAFSVDSAASGTVNGQRFFGGLLEGRPSTIRRGMV